MTIVGVWYAKYRLKYSNNMLLDCGEGKTAHCWTQVSQVISIKFCKSLDD